MNTLTQQDTEAMLSLALRAALEAGKRIKEIYTDPAQDFGIERKADHSPVTLADKAAHETIASMLAPTGLPLLSEEEGKHTDYEERQQWEAFWQVDPLDGTKEFIKRNGEFTVNIALIVTGSPQMGVVYAPARKELYFADTSIGAFKASGITEWSEEEHLTNLIASSLRLPIQREREEFVIVASRSHMNANTKKFIQEAKQNNERVTTVSIGSSLKLCLVAEGAADAYPRYAGTHEWDTAAGHAVAVSAGCQVLKVQRNGAITATPLKYNKKDLRNPWLLVTRIKS